MTEYGTRRSVDSKEILHYKNNNTGTIFCRHNYSYGDVVLCGWCDLAGIKPPVCACGHSESVHAPTCHACGAVDPVKGWSGQICSGFHLPQPNCPGDILSEMNAKAMETGPVNYEARLMSDLAIGRAALDQMRASEGSPIDWKGKAERLEAQSKEDINTMARVIRERDELLAWKREAMSAMPEYQAIGTELGLNIGETVSDKILPALVALKRDLQDARESAAHNESQKDACRKAERERDSATAAEAKMREKLTRFLERLAPLFTELKS